MSESIERVRELARALGLTIGDDRLDQLAQAYEQAMAEADAVRIAPTPMPKPGDFSAAWSEKK